MSVDFRPLKGKVMRTSFSVGVTSFCLVWGGMKSGNCRINYFLGLSQFQRNGFYGRVIFERIDLVRMIKGWRVQAWY